MKLYLRSILNTKLHSKDLYINCGYSVFAPNSSCNSRHCSFCG